MPRQKVPTLTLDHILHAKKQKKVRWLLLPQFHAARNLEAYEIPMVEPPFVQELTLHNQINRLTHTTADEGLLYTQEETWLNTKAYSYLSVYARVQPDWLDAVNQLMEDIGQSGIGARASTGKGVFSVQAVEAFSFPPISEANGVMVLSTYVPAGKESTYGFYKIKVKRGRLGGDYANRANPFKKPLITITPGSAFYGSTDKLFLGRIVPSVLPAQKHVVQCGLAFTLPAKLPPLDPNSGEHL
jgi:CRISPR type III-A-associated RAMP protein Csm4